MSISARASIVKGYQFFRRLTSQIEGDIEQLVSRRVEEALEEAVTMLLGRGSYERPRSSDRTWVEARCQRCGSGQRSQFSRNGHRPRSLITMWAVLSIWLPRLICQCGGSVSFDFYGLLKPRQRLWHDCDEQILLWSKLALSLREIKSLLDSKLWTSFGLRTLNRRLHQIAESLSLQPVPAGGDGRCHPDAGHVRHRTEETGQERADQESQRGEDSMYHGGNGGVA